MKQIIILSHVVRWHELTLQTTLYGPHDIPIIIDNITFTEYTLMYIRTWGLQDT